MMSSRPMIQCPLRTRMMPPMRAMMFSMLSFQFFKGQIVSHSVIHVGLTTICWARLRPPHHIQFCGLRDAFDKAFTGSNRLFANVLESDTPLVFKLYHAWKLRAMSPTITSSILRDHTIHFADEVFAIFSAPKALQIRSVKEFKSCCFHLYPLFAAMCVLYAQAGAMSTFNLDLTSRRSAGMSLRLKLVFQPFLLPANARSSIYSIRPV